MSRLATLCILIALVVGIGAVAAQEPPTQQFATLPPAEAPTTVPPTSTFEATLPPAPGATLPPPTLSALGVEQTEALPILIAARGDLELLATAAIGTEQRPLGWSGSLDVGDPQLPLLIRLDLELLAGAVVGADERPEGWFGVVPSVPLAVARDIRHDLELLADRVVGAAGIRPAGWSGDDPLMRCTRATQALFTLLESQRVNIEVDFTQPNYCAAAQNAASIIVERNILQPAVVSAPGTTASSNQLRYPYMADNPFVVAFLDRAARRKIGVLPVGTGFEPVGRSTFEFSNMMLIRGDNFQVFVDYTTTQITAGQFLVLPEASADSLTDCSAAWCGVGLD